MSTRLPLLAAFVLLSLNLGITAAQKTAAEHTMPTGSDLLIDCKQAMRVINGDNTLTDLEFVNASRCTGYINGVVDGYAVTEAAEKARIHFSSSLICFPKTGFMPTPRAVGIVAKFLRDNPTHLAEPGASLVLSAMQQEFPCK